MANISDQTQLVIYILAIIPKHVLNADVDPFPSVFLQFLVSTVCDCYLFFKHFISSKEDGEGRFLQNVVNCLNHNTLAYPKNE
jgi:hypothetical protein